MVLFHSRSFLVELITQGNSHREGLGERFQFNEFALFQITKVNLWIFYANTLYLVNYLKQKYILNGKNIYDVTVNFMCQPDLATGCPDDWFNIILVCVCEGVSGWKLHLNLSLSKAEWSPRRGWASSNMLKAWMELKGRVTGNSCSLPGGLQAGTRVFSWLQTQAETLVFLWSWACQLSD